MDESPQTRGTRRVVAPPSYDKTPSRFNQEYSSDDAAMIDVAAHALRTPSVDQIVAICCKKADQLFYFILPTLTQTKHR